MHHVVYKITNRLNGKVYVGSHSTHNLDDGYMGSGKLIRSAIQKYGVNNFDKCYLGFFDDIAEMFNYEKSIVNEEFVKSDLTYNLKEGGDGGWEYVNSNLLNKSKNQQSLGGKEASLRRKTDEAKMKLHKERASSNMKRAHLEGKIRYDTKLGTPTSDETKEKISLSMKGKNAGSQNPQFGTRWISNPILKINKKLSHGEDLPDGWAYGRNKF